MTTLRLFEILAKGNSGSIAKRRLKLLLVSDRADCTPEILEMIKDDMKKSMSKYIETDMDGLELWVSRAETETAQNSFPMLCVRIPLRPLLTKGTY